MASLLRKFRGKSSKNHKHGKHRKSKLNCLCAGFPDTDDIDDSTKPGVKEIEEAKNGEDDRNVGAVDEQVDKIKVAEKDMGKAESKVLKGTVEKVEFGKEPQLLKVVDKKLAESRHEGGDGVQVEKQGNGVENGEVVEKHTTEKTDDIGTHETEEVVVHENCKASANDTEDIGTDVDIRRPGSPVLNGADKQRRGSNTSSASSEAYESCGEDESKSEKDKNARKVKSEEKDKNKEGEVNETSVQNGNDSPDGVAVDSISPEAKDKDEKSSESSVSESEDSTNTGVNETNGTKEEGDVPTKSKWKKKNPLLKMQSKVMDAITGENIDNLSPEVCIGLLKNANLKFLSNLNRKLKQNDKTWNGEFLDLNGAQALLDLVDALGVRRVTQLSDALLLLECVQCVKTIMNSKMGLAYLVENGADLNRLVRGKFIVTNL